MPVPVLVHNNEDGPTVFTDHISKDYVEWSGDGDLMGGDVQIVPEAFFNNANFIRALQRGTFEIVNQDEHPELSKTLEKQMKYSHIAKQREVSDGRRDARRTEDTEALELTVDKDLVSLECVGPATKGTGICGTDVPVRAGRKNDTPPLCAKHSTLANEYIPEEIIRDGESTKKWSRVTVGKRRSLRDND